MTVSKRRGDFACFNYENKVLTKRLEMHLWETPIKLSWGAVAQSSSPYLLGQLDVCIHSNPEQSFDLFQYNPYLVSELSPLTLFIINLSNSLFLWHSTLPIPAVIPSQCAPPLYLNPASSGQARACLWRNARILNGADHFNISQNTLKGAAFCPESALNSSFYRPCLCS